jgi:DNA-binding transcriptional LysR family regulator
MDIIKLRAFFTVASLGSVGKAAEKLNYTQPAISAQIRELERELRTRLFEKVGRHIQLTADGKALLPHAETLFRDFESCQKALPRNAEGPGRLLRIGASSLPGVHMLPGLIADYRRQDSETRITLTIQGAYAVERLLFDQQVDAGFIGRKQRSRAPGRATEWVLSRDDMVAVVPIGHPWARRKAISFEQLADEPLILPPRNILTRRSVEERFRKLGLELHLAFEVGNPEAIKRMVAMRLGASILCASSVAKEVDAGWLATVPLEGLQLYRYICLIMLRDRTGDPALARFRDFVLRRFSV